MRDVTKKVNVRHIETDDVTQTNKLAMAAALYVEKEVVVKKGKIGENTVEKKRIEINITSLIRDINRLERETRVENEGKGKGKIKEFNGKYRVKNGNKSGH